MSKGNQFRLRWYLSHSYYLLSCLSTRRENLKKELKLTLGSDSRACGPHHRQHLLVLEQCGQGRSHSSLRRRPRLRRHHRDHQGRSQASSSRWVVLVFDLVRDKNRNIAECPEGGRRHIHLWDDRHHSYCHRIHRHHRHHHHDHHHNHDLKELTAGTQLASDVPALYVAFLSSGTTSRAALWDKRNFGDDDKFQISRMEGTACRLILKKLFANSRNCESWNLPRKNDTPSLTISKLKFSSIWIPDIAIWNVSFNLFIELV